MSKFSLLHFILIPSLAGLSSCAPGLIGSTDGSLLSTSTSLVGLSYTTDQIAIPNGTAMTAITPSFASGTAASWSVSPALPTGISLNASTGVISGTPTATTPGAATASFTNYTITATDASGGTKSYTIRMLVPTASIIVNNTTWGNDASPANGICEGCSIKGAIDTLNGAGSSAQTVIYVQPGTYSLTSMLSITKTTLTDVIVCGSDKATTILDAGSAVRFFQVLTAVTPLNLTFCNLTLQNGRLTGAQTGVIDFEQGIAGGSVTLSNVIIKDTTSAATAAGGGGGAVWVGHWMGYAMSLTIDRSSFINNVARQTGAVWVYSGVTTTISNSYFANNTASVSSGGAITIDTSSLTLSNSTFVGNTAAGSGGAISFLNNNTLNIVNSTFSGNSTTGSTGGAIDIAFATTTGNIRLTTFVNNTATAAASGGAFYSGGGAVAVNMMGNIFKGNTSNAVAEHCGNSATTVTSAGYNVYETGGGSCGALVGSDLTTASTGLAAALALNGGEVLNYALDSSSLAIDMIPSATCTAVTSLDTRNYARLSGSACDAGAFEL